MRYQYVPPLIIQKLFSSYIWNTADDRILFSFDDGPLSSTTGMILKELNEQNIKAIFFCVGNNIEKNPSAADEILKEGHEIGNHTFNHKRLTKISIKEAEDEINNFNRLMIDKFGYTVRYFRPPHGLFTLSLSKILSGKNMNNVMWSLLTYDYKNNLNIIKLAVANYLTTNSIIVLHDSLKSKEIITDSIKIIAEAASVKGFEIGNPAGCLK
jgi:peptidoglycan-N-acetylglucosamine deacetylase